MIDQPGIADRTGEAMTAGAAQGQRRVAAAIEEQQRLFAPLHGEADLLDETRRDEAAAGWRLAAQVDRLDMGHMLAAKARRKRHPLIAALARIDLRFDRWRGGRQHNRNF